MSRIKDDKNLEIEDINEIEISNLSFGYDKNRIKRYLFKDRSTWCLWSRWKFGKWKEYDCKTANGLL